MKREKYFATEADLCTAFISWASRNGWTAYAETCGWDILMVDKHGAQIGIQAKLKLNDKVIQQTIPECSIYGRDIGPDHVAILVPEHGAGIGELLGAVGVSIFYPENPRYGLSQCGFSRQSAWQMPMFDWNPQQRHKLPEYVPDVQAGASGPVQLSEWKIGALKILAILEIRGFVTRGDFNIVRIDYRRWVTSGWLVSSTPGRWVMGTSPRFDEQHPVVYPKVKADMQKWLATQLSEAA